LSYHARLKSQHILNSTRVLGLCAISVVVVIVGSIAMYVLGSPFSPGEYRDAVLAAKGVNDDVVKFRVGATFSQTRANENAAAWPVVVL
jgi:hypothetical protein